MQWWRFFSNQIQGKTDLAYIFRDTLHGFMRGNNMIWNRIIHHLSIVPAGKQSHFLFEAERNLIAENDNNKVSAKLRTIGGKGHIHYIRAYHFLPYLHNCFIIIEIFFTSWRLCYLRRNFVFALRTLNRGRMHEEDTCVCYTRLNTSANTC